MHMQFVAQALLDVGVVAVFECSCCISFHDVNQWQRSTQAQLYTYLVIDTFHWLFVLCASIEAACEFVWRRRSAHRRLPLSCPLRPNSAQYASNLSLTQVIGVLITWFQAALWPSTADTLFTSTASSSAWMLRVQVIAWCRHLSLVCRFAPRIDSPNQCQECNAQAVCVLWFLLTILGLWMCLSCGFVGCGRQQWLGYEAQISSNSHALEFALLGAHTDSGTRGALHIFSHRILKHKEYGTMDEV